MMAILSTIVAILELTSGATSRKIIVLCVLIALIGLVATIRQILSIKKKAHVREQLGALIAEGLEYQNEFIDNNTDEEEVKRKATEWGYKAEKLLEQELGKSYAVRFWNNAGLSPMHPVGNFTETRRNRWSWVHRRLERLEQFSRELGTD